jgi:hypothetical protein
MGKLIGKKIDLDELVIGKLPDEVLSALSRMKIDVVDIQEWDETRPKFILRAQGSYLDVDMRLKLHIPWKKYFLIVSSVISLTVLLIKLFYNYESLIRPLMSTLMK